jgi:hypothetical protein
VVQQSAVPHFGPAAGGDPHTAWAIGLISAEAGH